MTDICIIGQTALGFDVMLTQSDSQIAFTPYVVTVYPLDQVWSGDDPANPNLTLFLRFPDQQTAQSVLANLWPQS